MYRTLPYLALFAATVLLQVFLFDNLSISIYLNPLVYIVFIALLPLDTPPAAVLGAGLALGVTMDFAMGAAGINTIATLLIAFLRPTLAGMICGRDNVREGGIPLAAALWTAVRWPLLTLLLSFTALGAVGIPAIFVVRGFLLSFAVSSFVRIFGGAGAILAFFAFGFTGLISLPVLFLLGVQGLLAAMALAGRVLVGGKSYPSHPNRAFWVRSGLCAAALAFSAALECWAVPALLASVADLF